MVQISLVSMLARLESNCLISTAFISSERERKKRLLFCESETFGINRHHLGIWYDTFMGRKQEKQLLETSWQGALRLLVFFLSC